MFKLLPKFLLLSVVLTSPLANANWYYGLLSLKPANKYIGDKASPMIFPVIGYKSDTILFTGKDLRYTYYSSERLSLYAGLSARFDGFDEDDSAYFTGLDKRKNSLDFVAKATFENEPWSYSLTIKQDVLAVHKGFELNPEIGYKIEHFAPLFVSAKLGAKYLSENLAQYYYGVSENESNIVPSYHFGSGFIGQAKLQFFTPIFWGGITRLEIAANRYSSSLSDSPLIDSDTSFSAMFMFLKPF